MKHHWNYEPGCSSGKTPNFMADAAVEGSWEGQQLISDKTEYAASKQGSKNHGLVC